MGEKNRKRKVARLTKTKTEPKCEIVNVGKSSRGTNVAYERRDNVNGQKQIQEDEGHYKPPPTIISEGEANDEAEPHLKNSAHKLLDKEKTDRPWDSDFSEELDYLLNSPPVEVLEPTKEDILEESEKHITNGVLKEEKGYDLSISASGALDSNNSWDMELEEEIDVVGFGTPVNSYTTAASSIQAIHPTVMAIGDIKIEINNGEDNERIGLTETKIDIDDEPESKDKAREIECKEILQHQGSQRSHSQVYSQSPFPNVEGRNLSRIFSTLSDT